MGVHVNKDYEIPPTLKQYGVWEANEGFWMLYDSKVDAVREHGADAVIYLMSPRKLGRYFIKTTLQKRKRRRARTK
jgi:hypothetical protein